MIENCEYTLRHLLKTMENYHALIETNTDIDYFKKLTFSKNLRNIINNLRGYLSLPERVVKKQSISEMFKTTKKFLKTEY